MPGLPGVKRSVDPETVEAQGNVGVSSRQAEAILASIGVERSPLVAAIRRAQQERASEVVHHIIVVPPIEEGGR